MTSSTEASGSSPFNSPLYRKNFARGKWEGKREASAEDILIVLEERNLDVTDAERARIVKCTSLKQLKAWLWRAATAEKASDIFD